MLPQHLFHDILTLNDKYPKLSYVYIKFSFETVYLKWLTKQKQIVNRNMIESWSNNVFVISLFPAFWYLGQMGHLIFCHVFSV